jgi:peptidoglycan/xylan/chitin deacetylase (PgdA/CDA1 family)
MIKDRFDRATKALWGPVSHVSTSEQVAALTFDDGPDPRFTPDLLDILDKHHAKGTFFVLGEAAQRYPEIIRSAAERGHEIGNHSWDHPSFALIDRRERRRQLKACAEVIKPYHSRLFRPPYGHQSVPACMDAVMLGYRVIKWNKHAFDWLDHDAKWMAEHMESEIHPGNIIALHDALRYVLDDKYADRRPTLNAVDMLLATLAGRYQFVTVTQLLSYGTPQLQSCLWKADREFLQKLKVNNSQARADVPACQVSSR